MLVSQIVAELRDRMAAESSIEVNAPVFALSSWFIDIVLRGFRVTVEYVPELGLFGLSTRGCFEGSEEVYREIPEIVDRVQILASHRQLCSQGKVSLAAYSWSQQEAARLKKGPLWSEHMAVIQRFEQP